MLWYFSVRVLSGMLILGLEEDRSVYKTDYDVLVLKEGLKLIKDDDLSVCSYFSD